MDLTDFRKDFLGTVKVTAIETGLGSCFSFVDHMTQMMIEGEILPDFVPAFYKGKTQRGRIFRVDGYVLDELDYTMNLIIADYDGIEKRTITKTQAMLLFDRLGLFISQTYHTNLHEAIEMSMPCADLIELLRFHKQNIRKYRLIIVTDAELSQTIKELEYPAIEGVITECQIWTLERLHRLYSSDEASHIQINFTDYTPSGIPCLQASTNTNDYTSYLCVIPAHILADIYDRYGGQLLEGNVRSFLSTKVAVNKKIRETILKSPTMFFAYNNGISATARNVTINATKNGVYLVSAQDFQIINGGQTTASLSNARHKDKATLDTIYVQMKLTKIGASSGDETANLVRNISRSSNSQNKVSDADFFATHPFHIRIEKISRRLFAPPVGNTQYETRWFYERARGQYLQAQMRMTKAQKDIFTRQHPRNQVFSKTDLAKVHNTWNGVPHIVSKGAQASFMYFAEVIDKKWSTNELQFNERYFQDSVALLILFRGLEKMIPTQSWYEQGYRANIVTYSIALLRVLIHRHFTDMDLDLQTIWNRQHIPEQVLKILATLAERVFTVITDPSRPTINVTQWCKQPACLQRVQTIDIHPPSLLQMGLIARQTLKEAEREAKTEQKMVSAIEAQTEVVKYTGTQWEEVLAFSLKQALLSPEDEKALRVACRIPEKLPNSYQSQRLLVVLDKIQAEGFVFSQ